MVELEVMKEIRQKGIFHLIGQYHTMHVYAGIRAIKMISYYGLIVFSVNKLFIIIINVIISLTIVIQRNHKNDKLGQWLWHSWYSGCFPQ